MTIGSFKPIFKGKYLDLYDSIKGDTQKEKVAILNDIGFERELIRRDEINVVYILNKQGNDESHSSGFAILKPFRRICNPYSLPCG